MKKVTNIIRFISDSNRGSFSEYVRKAYTIKFNFVFDFYRGLEQFGTEAYRIEITPDNIESVYNIFTNDVLKDRLEKKDAVYVFKKVITRDEDTFIFESLKGMVFCVLEPIKETLDSESPSYTQRNFRIDCYEAMKFIIRFSDLAEHKRLVKLCNQLLKEKPKKVTVQDAVPDSHPNIKNRYKVGF